MIIKDSGDISLIGMHIINNSYKDKKISAQSPKKLIKKLVVAEELQILNKKKREIIYYKNYYHQVMSKNLF